MRNVIRLFLQAETACNALKSHHDAVEHCCTCIVNHLMMGARRGFASLATMLQRASDSTLLPTNLENIELHVSHVNAF